MPLALLMSQVPKKKVLVIHSYHQGLLWTDNISRGIENAFSKWVVQADLYFEYLDTKRFSGEDYFESLLLMEKSKVRNNQSPYDVIICADNNALAFLRKNRESLYPGVPIVFCGINNYQPTLIEGMDKSTGVIEFTDYRATLEVMRQNHPDAEKVIVVVDRTPTGDAIAADFQPMEEIFRKDFHFEYYRDFLLSEVPEKLRNLNEEDLIYLLAFNRDRENQFISYSDAAHLFRDKSPVPVYGSWDFYFGKGIVGGIITSGVAQGEVAGELAIEILQGRKASDLPVVSRSINRYMFDHQELKRFGISTHRLPDDSLIINAPPSFYERNQSWLNIIAALSVLALLFSLWRNNHQKQKARQLKKMNQQLEEKVKARTQELSDTNRGLTQEIVERKKLETNLQEKERIVRKKLNAIYDNTIAINSLELPDIIDAESIQSMMMDFYETTGILSAILDLEGNILVAAGWQDICTKFHRINPESAKHCRESDTELTRDIKPGKFKTYKCKNNLWDMATPLVIAGKQFGNIFFGQFFFDDESIDREFFRAQARKYGFDEKEYLAALERVPRFNREYVERAMGFYVKLSEMISQLSFRNIQMARTVNELNKAKETINDQLEEKQRLLRELKHRIKNSFSIIYSMLRLQTYEGLSEKENSLMSNIMQRVQTISHLYSLFDTTEDSTSVDLSVYCHSIVASLKQAYTGIANKVTLTTHCEKINTDMKKASTLGLCINEIITNSLKYAFPSDNEGEILVEIKRHGDSLSLAIRDNGIGLPADFDIHQSSGLGTSLVYGMVQQMNGTISVKGSEGTAYTISIPLEV